MVTLDDIKRAVDNLEDTIRGAIASGKITPKQIVTVQGLSDINNSLGTVRAGDFLAMSSGTEPTASDGTGTFISALGRMFGSKTYHIGGVKSGDLKWGANSLTGELEAGDGAVVLTGNGISIYNSTTEVGRIGNLNGFLAYAADTYGFGFGTEDAYITWDPIQGLKVINATTTEGDGWTASGLSWTPEDAWDPGADGAIRVPQSYTEGPYSTGTKLKYTQDATTKYAEIISNYPPPGGDNYYQVVMHSGSFTKTAVTNPYYSALSAPDGW